MPWMTGHGVGADPPCVAYVYAPDRKANGRSLISKASRGFFKSTAMPATASSPSAATLRSRSAGCICGATSTNSPPPARRQLPARRSSTTEFYAIEKNIRGRSAEERCLIRQRKSWPLADTFQNWLRAKLALISQKGKLAEAIRYALSRQHRAIQRDALPRVNLDLPVQRQMIGAFGHQNLGDGGLGRQPALDQPRRSRRLHDAVLAGSAGLFGPPGDQDPELRRH